LERVGLPTAHVCAITSVALMVGSNRVVNANKIIAPLGNEKLDAKAEKAFRRAIIEKALKTLQTDVDKPTLFKRPT